MQKILLLKQKKRGLGRREQKHYFFCKTWKTRGVFSKLIIKRQRAVNITASLAFRFSLKLTRRRDSSKEAVSEVLDASKTVLLDNSKENQIAIKWNCSSPLFVYQIDRSVPVTYSISNCDPVFPPFPYSQDSRWRRPGGEALCFLEETLPSFVRVGQPAMCVASKSLLIPTATLAGLVFRAGAWGNPDLR